MNKQEIVNVVAAALRNQGAASMSDEGFCASRGSNGNRCAVGHLIPDSMYDIKMENKTATELIDKFPQVGPSIGGDNSFQDIFFLARLQMELHDRYSIVTKEPKVAFSDWFEKALSGFCEAEGLEFPALP